jgi:glycosyltransferase involved in cell wall biosynthesis
MRLAELARSLRIVENVRFVGRVGHEDIHRYYAIVDLFVYPRRSMRLTELVTPLKPLEAMAQTRLVIASDVGGHRELIRDGETGVLFKAGDANGLADAVIGVLGDPERARSMRAEARRFVEQERTWQNSVGRYRPVFERLQRDAQRARARTREAGLPG